MTLVEANTIEGGGSDARQNRIRTLNDQLRQTGRDGRLVVTAGIAALQAAEIMDVMAGVAQFNAFSADNDPWGEHDCATMKIGEHNIIWKIDYYDPTLSCGSSDPADATITCRVLTIMLSEEY